MSEKNNTASLGWGTRVAYGLGDTACNVVFGMITALLTLFYTDYCGIPVVTVGLVMLISRIFDGSSDVIMGIIVSKTKSKWGKARPWILWMSVPYVLCAVAMFCVPHSSTTIQFWYIFVTYNLCTTVCYTAINVPYGTLSTMMTRSSHERDLLSVVRMALSPIGKIIAVTFTMPVVKLFGNDQTEDEQTVVRECAACHGQSAGQEFRCVYVNALCAENRTCRLLQDQADAPGSQQRIDLTAVQPGNDQLFQHDTEQERRRKGERQRCDVVPVAHGAWQKCREHLLGDVGHVCADHNELAVRHVDDAHQSERDGQSERGQQDNRAETQAVKQRGNEFLHCVPSSYCSNP